MNTSPSEYQHFLELDQHQQQHQNVSCIDTAGLNQVSNDTDYLFLSLQNIEEAVNSSDKSSDDYLTSEFFGQDDQKNILQYEFEQTKNYDFDLDSESANISGMDTDVSSSLPRSLPANIESRTRAGRTWTCDECHEKNFRSRIHVMNHKNSEHVNSVRIRSKVDLGRELVHFIRDPLTKMFQCRCGSLFKSITNAFRHRKCYEVPEFPDITIRDENSLSDVFSADEINECLNKFQLSLIDSCVIFCRRCLTILLRENFRDHIRTYHEEKLSSRDNSILMKVTSNQNNSKYVKLANASFNAVTELGSVKPFETIENVTVHSGFRCCKCNLGDLTLDKLSQKHQKFNSSFCDEKNERFVACDVQVLRIGSRMVGFGVIKEDDIYFEGGLIINHEEYIEIQRIVSNFEVERRSGIDSIESQLYRNLGWFRKNEEGTDFLDYSIDVISRVNSFLFQEHIFVNLLDFFKSKIAEVSSVKVDLRLLLSDEKSMSIRPITDQSSSYAKYFVEIFRIVSAFVTLNMASVASEDTFNQLSRAVNVMIRHEGPFVFSDLMDIWGILVDQNLTVSGEDLLKLVIRFKSFDSRTGQLKKSSAVEQMAAKSFYFCRLFKLNMLINSDTTSFPRIKRNCEVYFKSNDSTFHRLCYLKGLARDMAESEEINPVIYSGDHSENILIDGIEITPLFLNRAFLGIKNAFSDAVGELLLGISLNLDTFAIIDKYDDNSDGFGMRSSNGFHSSLLISQVRSSNETLRDRFFIQGCLDSPNVEAIKKYIMYHDRSCRILCALIHLSSGVTTKATEMHELRFVNGTSARNVYFIDGQIKIVSRNNTTDSLIGRKNIISRYLPSCVSKLIAVWIIVIRPLYSYFLSLLDQPLSQSLKYLFVKNGKLFTDRDVRVCFEESTLKFAGAEILYSKYRQVVQHFVKNVLHIRNHPILDDQGLNDDQIEDVHFGHFDRVRRNDHGLKRRDYNDQDFRRMSSIWHEFLVNGISTGIRRFNSETGVNFREVKVDTFEREVNLINEEPSEQSHKISLIKKVDFLRLEAALQSYTLFREFKSSEQRLCSAIATFTTIDFLSIIPPGGGKSLIFFIYALMVRSEGLNTVVIVPTKVLQSQLFSKCREFGLRGSDNLENKSISEIFFVTLESFVQNSNQIQVKSMINGNSLKRIFFIEAHFILLDAHFRVDLERLSFFKQLNISLTFLTSSMSVRTSDELASIYRRNDRQFRIVRCSTNSPNLLYKVVKEGSVNDLDIEINQFFSKYSSSQCRLIVYVNAIESINLILKSSSYQALMTSYLSTSTDFNNTQSLSFWISGVKPILIATSGFSVGINYPPVRMVICFGKPYNIEELAQQFGQAGRDGSRSEAILLPLRKDSTRCSTEMNEFAENFNICRRHYISEIIDSYPIDCLSSSSFERCDVCAQGVSISFRS